MLLGVGHCISQAESALSVCVHVLHCQSLCIVIQQGHEKEVHR